MTQLDPSQPLTLIPMDPAALGRLLEEAAERGARQALATQSADGFLSSEQTAALLGYRRADGRPNVTAFKSFRQRHPEFLALASHFGKRLRWRRSDVEKWMAAQRRPRSGSPTTSQADTLTAEGARHAAP